MAMNLRIFMPGISSEGQRRTENVIISETPAEPSQAWEPRDAIAVMPETAPLTREAMPDAARFPREPMPEAVRLSAPEQVLLRFFDLAVAVAALTLLALPMMIIALVVKLDSPGPVLFKQRRVGKDGREFWFYKFRSMVADAEARRAALLQMNEASGPLFKIKNDPRITRSGRWLRKFSLDELPQLFNVVKGDMSLVGPRPSLPVEVAQYTIRQRGRLAVKPGITGLWQVSGRSDLPFDRSIELDLEYIERQSLWLYVKILWRTFPAVLQGRGAY